MAIIAQATLQLLEDFAVPLGGGNLHVRFERGGPAGPSRPVGHFGGRYIATLELATSKDVALDPLALTHAADVDAYLRDFVKEHLAPWRAKLIRAGGKAIDVWQDELG